jgi:hypothetical protein
MKNSSSKQITYDPNHLLNTVMAKLGLKNDAAFCRALDVAPPVISKIRHHRIAVGASFLIRLHDVSELSITELRALMGDRRKRILIKEMRGIPGSGGITGSNRSAAADAEK